MRRDSSTAPACIRAAKPPLASLWKTVVSAVAAVTLAASMCPTAAFAAAGAASGQVGSASSAVEAAGVGDEVDSADLEGATEIVPDEQVSLTINDSYVYYKFIPTEDGTYYFYTTGEDSRPVIRIVTWGGDESSAPSIVAESNDTCGDNCQISYECEEGETYYFGVRNYYDGTANTTICVSMTPGHTCKLESWIKKYDSQGNMLIHTEVYSCKCGREEENAFTWTYDEEGNCLTEYFAHTINDSVHGWHSYVYTYNEDGQKLSEAYEENGYYSSMCYWTYDEDGNKATETAANTDGTAYVKYYTDGTETSTVSYTSVSVPEAAGGLVYDGTEQVGLATGTGYTIVGGTATEAGTYTATAALDEGYMWADATFADKEIAYTIEPADIGVACIALGFSSCTYNGAVQKPLVTVTYGGDALAEGADYTVSYADNINVGTASATVTGAGNYGGTLKATFTITKASQTIKLGKKNMTVKTGKKKAVKVTGAKTSLQKKLAKKAKKNLKVTVKGKKVVVKAKKNAKKGTYKVKIRSKASSDYKASSWKTIIVKVK